jgi:hypothetical protein
MIRHRIFLCALLLAAIAAHSQPTKDRAGALSNAAPAPSLKALLQAAADSRPANDRAGVYSTMAVPSLKALLQSLDPTAKVVEGTNGNLTNFTCEWPDVTVRFTLQPDWKGPDQRAGMKKWIAKLPGGDQNTPAVAALLEKVDSSVACIGSVITPRYDPAGKASSLVLGLAAKLHGYVFAQGSFYDATGAKIIGRAGAPLELKDQP